MGKKCESCKKKCSGDIFKVDGDKYFHIACFKCAKCQRPLSDQRFYPTPDGTYLCQEDYKMISKQISVVPTDARAKKAPGSTNGSSSQQPIGGATSTSTIGGQGPASPPLGSPSNCAACDQPLQMTQVLFALGQSWHVFCFKCTECAAVLQGEYMASEGKPLCLRDFNEKFGVKCHECNKFIAGKVLQAGAYKFHPTCARCSRCGDHFGDGVEMCMQADEIWHPSCEHARTTENIAPSARGGTAHQRSGNEPKYQAQFGQHHTYMYLLPEAEQTYLKHPIPIHNPQPAQYHTPQAPIKIRKSRMSMLKTGMQRLTEDLEKTSIPRAKSPHMDNEEPIEMAHYPGGHAPEPGEMPPIERDDFPAPQYPYAVEELKRRLSSSSIENDVSDDEFSDNEKFDEARMKKTVEKLEQLEVDSSIAAIIKQNIEESNNKQRLPLHWDPRNASRTPSAKKMPHLRFRYDTPINASPSRHMNRPKPWVVWQGGSKDHGNTLPCFHLPESRSNTMRAATLPNAYAYGHNLSSGDLDQTISSHYSDHSLSGVVMGGTAGGATTMRPAAEVKPILRSSLPDMSKPARVYTLAELQTSNKEFQLPDEVDRQHLERHLSRDEFEATFGMSPIEFYKLPEWKRINLKRKHKLF